MKDERVYLSHILESLDAIRSYKAEDRDIFFNDRKTRKATLRELQELAESTRRLPSSLKARYPEIPWHDIAGFRNVLVHNYLGLKTSRIWDIIERDLPVLRTAIELMLRELNSNTTGT